MTQKINLTFIGLISLILVSLISCGTGFNYNDISPEDEKSFQDYVLTSYYLLKDTEEPAAPGLSRATFPAHTTTKTFVELTGEPQTLYNYPEEGQDTVFTTENITGDRYKITAVTTYHPEWETEIESFTETYYIFDNNANNTLDTDDIITDASGAVDPLYREVFQAKYLDGTTRYYWLLETHPSGTAGGYAPFDIDGDLTFPAGAWNPPTSNTAHWSSMVRYAQTVNQRWLFWRKSDKLLVGARYYTEHGADPLNPTKTSVSYERMVYGVDTTGLKQNETKESVDSWLAYLFDDGDAPLLLDAATLAETVIRYQITPGTTEDTKIIRQRTEVVNKFGEDFVFQAGTDTEAADPGDSVPVSF